MNAVGEPMTYMILLMAYSVMIGQELQIEGYLQVSPAAISNTLEPPLSVELKPSRGSTLETDVA
jgi:hypothetical protein